MTRVAPPEIGSIHPDFPGLTSRSDEIQTTFTTRRISYTRKYWKTLLSNLPLSFEVAVAEAKRLRKENNPA